MLVTVLCSVILSDSVALNLNYLLTNGSSWISSWLGLDRFFKCYNWLFSTFHAVDWKCGKLWKATSYSRCCLVWITEFTCHVIASVALLYPLWQTIVCLSFVTNYPLWRTIVRLFCLNAQRPVVLLLKEFCFFVRYNCSSWWTRGGAGGVVIASKVDKKLVDLELHSPTQRPTIIVYNLFICGLENC